MRPDGTLNIKSNIKKLFYLVVLSALSVCHSGSYDDFFQAIKRDDAAEVSQLLNLGFDPNTLNSAGIPGLVLAIREPSLRVTDVLMNWPKTNIEARTPQDESPLMLAALQGLTEFCQQLIDKDADVNKPGWTPLHYAATRGHLAVMQLLLDHDAYIDAASPNNSTPLMMAAQYGTPSAVKLLLEAGADPMLKNDLGLSAIDFAQRANQLDSVEMISSFIRGRQTKGVW